MTEIIDWAYLQMKKNDEEQRIKENDKEQIVKGGELFRVNNQIYMLMIFHKEGTFHTSIDLCNVDSGRGYSAQYGGSGGSESYPTVNNKDRITLADVRKVAKNAEPLTHDAKVVWEYFVGKAIDVWKYTNINGESKVMPVIANTLEGDVIRMIRESGDTVVKLERIL